MFNEEKEMYPVLREFFDNKGFKTLSQAKFKMIKNWFIDVVAYDDHKNQLIAVEAKLNMENALDAISQAEMYQIACSKVYVAFPHYEWDSKENRERKKDVEEICKKRGIGILKVIGQGLTEPCEEIAKPPLSLRIDLLEEILQTIKTDFASFKGLDEDDFNYFVDHTSWKKMLVEKKLELLKTELAQLIPARAPLLKNHNIRLQRASKNYAGLNIFAGKDQTETKHFSVGMGAGFFSIFIQLPTNDVVRRFTDKLCSDRDLFLSLIRQLRDYELELYERTSKASHRRPMPGGTIYKRTLKISTDLISNISTLDEIVSQIRDKTRYPALNFSKDYDLDTRGYNIKREDLMTFIFQTIEELSPVYDFIP